MAEIDKVVEGYFNAKTNKSKIDQRVVKILRFATKFAENLGLGNFFGLDWFILKPETPKKEKDEDPKKKKREMKRKEVSFTLDPSLYFSEKKSQPKIDVRQAEDSDALSDDLVRNTHND